MIRAIHYGLTDELTINLEKIGFIDSGGIFKRYFHDFSTLISYEENAQKKFDLSFEWG